MKQTIFTLIIFFIGCAWGLGTGYVGYDYFNQNLGGVRGGSRTGFYLMSGEDMGIGTSTALADIYVYETATTSIAVDGTKGGCLRLLDIDGGGYTNITTLNGTISTSTDNTCGF